MDWGAGITYLAQTKFKGQMTPFGIKDADRFEHLSALGRPSNATGLLAQIALQDIARGVGTVILDATGGLTQSVLERIPESVTSRLIFLDPSDSENPFSWNSVDEFRALPREEATQLLSHAVAALYRIADSALTGFIAGWMLADTEATLLLLYELVTDETLRAVLPKEARAAFESLLEEHADDVTTVREQGRYLAKDLLVRNLLGQRESKVSLASLPEGGILVVDLSKIRVFPTRITPLVRLFVHTVRAQARRRNRPVTIFLNECIKYLEPADVARLFGERTLAFSFTDTVHSEEDEAHRERVLLHTSSIFACTLLAEDTKAGERIFYPYISPEELVALPEGEAAIALTIDGVRAKPFFASVLPLLPHQGISPHDLLIRSRTRYATPRQKVEEMLQKKTQNIEKEKDKDKDKDKDTDPGSFSDAFRSIFAKNATPPASPKAPPPAPAVKPAERIVPPTRAKSEIAEAELRTMLYVKPVY